jgi:hypothetical protein
MERRDFLKNTVIGGSLLGLSSLARAGEAGADSSAQSEKKETGKRSLVIYASRSGNTAKVAERFKSTFEKHGWQCDMYKIETDVDPMNLPFDIMNYDLVCAGSGIHSHRPYEELVTVIRTPFYGMDARSILYPDARLLLGIKDDEKWKQIVPPAVPPKTTMKIGGGGMHGKIVMPYNPKKAVVFTTYAGFEFGPEETQPALDYLALEIKHLKIETIGKFCCPARMGTMSVPSAWHDDIEHRPTERDLLRAELFMEEMIEAMADRSPKSA